MPIPTCRPTPHDSPTGRPRSLALVVAIWLTALTAPVFGDTLVDVQARIDRLHGDGSIAETLYSVDTPSLTRDLGIFPGPGSVPSSNPQTELIWSVDDGTYFSRGSVETGAGAINGPLASSIASLTEFWVAGDAGTEFSIARNGFGLLQSTDANALAGTGLSSYDITMSYLALDGSSVELRDGYAGTNAPTEMLWGNMLAGTYFGTTSHEARVVDGVTYTKALSLTERITVADPAVSARSTSAVSYATYDAFTTVAAVPVVPEPTPFVALVGLSLMGLVAMRLRRRNE